MRASTHAVWAASTAATRRDDDTRFRDNVGAIQSIATSSGQNDSGLFELNFRDERYLPFEGAGAISQWHIELPAAFRHLITTRSLTWCCTSATPRGKQAARSKQQAVTEQQDALNAIIKAAESTAWRGRSVHGTISLVNGIASCTRGPSLAGDQTLTLALGKDRFPYVFQGRDIAIDKIELFVKVKNEFGGTHNESTLKLSLEAGTIESHSALGLEPWKRAVPGRKAAVADRVAGRLDVDRLVGARRWHARAPRCRCDRRSC